MASPARKGSEGKWILFAVDTGEQLEFWAIDAKALLALGTHTTEPPAGVELAAPTLPPQHVQVPPTPLVQTFVAPEGEVPETATTAAAKSRVKAR